MAPGPAVRADAYRIAFRQAFWLRGLMFALCVWSALRMRREQQLRAPGHY
jgi:hypothetical protein